MMKRTTPFPRLRWMSVGFVVMLGFVAALPVVAEAVTVDCNSGQTIKQALALSGGGSGPKQLVITVRGTCNENVVITRDDVTINTNGVATATIAATDTSQPTVRLDGARRIVIDGVVANGITISGGTFGISASRNSTLDVLHCAITGASNTGIIGSLNSVVSVDACSVTGNGNGITAANTSSVVVTNSTVSGNTGNGLVGTRSSYLRVGQDLSGTPTAKPVTVSGNGSTGIAITEGSSGNIVGGTVQNSGGTNIFVGRASSGQIGLGSNNLTGGVAVQNGRRGIAVEGANATILFSTITGATLEGININAAASARIGVLNGNTGYGANTISGNATGIGVFHGGAAYIGGNTVTANTGIGINVFEATATIVGSNAITNNGQTGVLVHAGTVDFGNAGFELTTTNTISGNGSAGPNTGGIFAFKGGNILINDATISNNSGPGVQAFEAGTIELRGSTTVTVPGAGSTAGALVQFGSTLRLRDTASIISTTGDGIQASNLTSVNIRDGNIVQGNGAGAVGVRCFNTAPLPASAATLTGLNLTNITGATGATAGCNVFP